MSQINNPESRPWKVEEQDQNLIVHILEDSPTRPFPTDLRSCLVESIETFAKIAIVTGTSMLPSDWLKKLEMIDIQAKEAGCNLALIVGDDKSKNKETADLLGLELSVKKELATFLES